MESLTDHEQPPLDTTLDLDALEREVAQELRTLLPNPYASRMLALVAALKAERERYAAHFTLDHEDEVFDLNMRLHIAERRLELAEADLTRLEAERRHVQKGWDDAMDEYERGRLEVRRLQARIAKLEGSLREMAAGAPASWLPDEGWYIEKAQEALKATPEAAPKSSQSN